MPAKSQKQFKAMVAAMSGNSTLGISQSVGKDFVKATKNPSSLPITKKKNNNFNKLMSYKAK